MYNIRLAATRNMDEKEGAKHESDNTSKYQKYEVHEGIVFCIELSEAMFERPADLDKVQLIEILETLLELMSQVIITLPGTGIGCFFYQCNHEASRGGIYEFLPLLNVNARSMKKLNDLLEDIRTKNTTLAKEFPFDSSRATSLETMFIILQEQFLRQVPGQKAYNNRKIFLFTDNDRPKESHDPESRLRLRKVIDDLDDSFINFTTFFIGTKQKPFDQTFYSDVLKFGAKKKILETGYEFDGPSTAPISAKWIKSRALRKKEIKRVRFQCPLILDETNDFIVSIKGYTVITHERAGTRYKTVYDHNGLRKEVRSRRKYLNANTGEDATNTISRVYKFAEVDIELSEDEVTKIYQDFSSRESFLKLIGFRDTSKCLFYFDNISNSSFVVPDETTYEGSIRTLGSLFRNLTNKDKCAIVWGKLKSNSHPSLYVLSPSTSRDQNEGFYLSRIPFADEIRKFPPLINHDELLSGKNYEQMCKINETLINYFTLRRPYKPSEFRNPSLHKHFRLLHHHLLQIEVSNSSDSTDQQIKDDDTLAKLYQVRQKILDSAKSQDSAKERLSNYVKAWNSVYNKEYNQELEPEAKSKKPKKT
ncbi:LANO_0F14444g1_1 [Lachancea nothofagi CBS 11611]|uniref:ATP-dependent DNA helicase II subunit 1 n=1 Tax=Lachancea nothofagi CBS 11611 TaxID=1266666 RepID=A0A1G4KCC0_9SACH|nr:LANO_0F14444g1_1 [Lachancea nothofagi CBS 11611]